MVRLRSLPLALILLLLCLPATPALADAWDDQAAVAETTTGNAPADAQPWWAGDAAKDDRAWGDVGVPARPAPKGTEQRPSSPAPKRYLPIVPKGKAIAGRVARMRADGRAAIPIGAPKSVRRVIAAANQIVGRPYKWGGGHGSLYDSGYDCSGAVGYALIRASLLGGTMVSGQLARWGSGGYGRWITVYANNGHVYMEVAGLRLDTSPVGDPTGRMGVRWRPKIGRRGGFAVRHPAGL